MAMKLFNLKLLQAANKSALQLLLGSFSLFFFSTKAMACPRLSGFYICQESQGPVHGQMRQEEQSGVTEYTWTEDGQSLTVAADGIKRILSKEPHQQGLLIKSNLNFCKNESVEIIFEDMIELPSGLQQLHHKIHQVIQLTNTGLHIQNKEQSSAAPPVELQFDCSLQPNVHENMPASNR